MYLYNETENLDLMLYYASFDRILIQIFWVRQRWDTCKLCPIHIYECCSIDIFISRSRSARCAYRSTQLNGIPTLISALFCIFYFYSCWKLVHKSTKNRVGSLNEDSPAEFYLYHQKWLHSFLRKLLLLSLQNVVRGRHCFMTGNTTATSTTITYKRALVNG